MFSLSYPRWEAKEYEWKFKLPRNVAVKFTVQEHLAMERAKGVDPEFLRRMAVHDKLYAASRELYYPAEGTPLSPALNDLTATLNAMHRHAYAVLGTLEGRVAERAKVYHAKNRYHSGIPRTEELELKP